MSNNAFENKNKIAAMEGARFHNFQSGCAKRKKMACIEKGDYADAQSESRHGTMVLTLYF